MIAELGRALNTAFKNKDQIQKQYIKTSSYQLINSIGAITLEETAAKDTIWKTLFLISQTRHFLLRKTCIHGYWPQPLIVLPPS